MLDQIWGFDIGKFPAELSTVNLFRQNVKDYENFPRVRKTDIFDVVKGKTFDFPPPHSGSEAIKIHLELPEFNAIVGNFPYIRQELIEKEVKGYKRKLTRVLAEELLQTYPKLFELKGMKLADLTTPKQIERALRQDWFDLGLSGQADIYAYIYLHTATLLNSEGAFAIITSNSWLDVGYGSVLKQFFLDHFRVKMLIASWVEPWFEDAAINTIITVLEKEKNKEKRDNNPVHFVKLKKKLAELLPYDLKFEANRRWQKLDSIIATIEDAEYKPECKEIAKDISSYETEDLRVRIIPQRILEEELKQQGELTKWGKYLRAPDVYFEVIDKCKDKLVPLKEIANVRRGYTTGINDFYYLEIIEESKRGIVKCCNARGWEGEIECKYLKGIIKSPRESESITIDPAKLKYVLFLCDKSKAELRKEGDTCALNYIEWGERQKTEEGKSWKEVPSVQGRRHWWMIDEKEPGYILLQMINNDRFVAFLNKSKVQVDHNLFEFFPSDKQYLDTAEKYLNSHLFALIKEVNSRVSLGEGATKTEGVDWNNIMLIPKEKIDIRFSDSSFYNRKIKSVFEEIKLKDRNNLDRAVLNALGLDAKIFLPRIYEGLCEIVKERLDLPKMRKKQQKETIKIAVDQVKQAVIEECLANGPNKFPEQFYDHPLSDKDFERFSTSGEALRYEHFFGRYDMIDLQGQKVFEVDNENKAQFAIMLAKPNIYEIKIPKDEKIVKKTLTKYHKYLKELEEKLTKSAGQQTHDWAIAERIAKEIMEEYDLREM